MVAEVDEVRGVGRALGVVNTVAFESGGGSADHTRLVAYNTDVAGIVNALRHAGAAPAPTAVVLGGGGTAAAAIAALKELGAVSAEVFVRDPSRAAEARAASAAVGLPVQVLPLAGAAAAVAAADVVISTLPPRAADPLAVELADALAAELAEEPAAPPAESVPRNDAAGRRRTTPSGGSGRPGASWTSPTIRGPAGLPRSGRKPAARWSRDLKCSSTRRWSRSGTSPDWARPSQPES